MDKIKLFIIMVSITVYGMKCDTDCDCKTIMELQMELQEFIQKEMFQNKFEISKMNSRLRRIEGLKRHLTGTNNKVSGQEPDRQSTPGDQDRDNRDSVRIDSLEAKVTSIASILKINDLISTDVTQATKKSGLLDQIETNLTTLSLQVHDLKKSDANKLLDQIETNLTTLSLQVQDLKQSDADKLSDQIETNLTTLSLQVQDLKKSDIDKLLDQIETNLTTLSLQVKDLKKSDADKLLDQIETNLTTLSLQVQDLKKSDANNHLLVTIVKKTLSSEKRNRKKFMTVVKNAVENINNSVSEMRTETESLMKKYNETFVKRCDKSIEAMKEVTVNINKTMYEEIYIITEALNDLTEELSDANKEDGEWSSWENWGSCSVSCDGGIQSRLRTCSNPRPSLLGRYCDGSPDEIRTCNKRQCADGEWSSWENWGSCSASCGGGIQSRLRSCSNPRPSLLGRYCNGTPDETRTCNKRQCAELKVAFTAYYLDTSPSIWSTTLVFRSVYINYGNAYSTSTGKFTCKVPGLYHFSVTLTKAYHRLSNVYARLRINGNTKLQLWLNPYNNDDKFEWGATPLTHSGTFHLNKNDVVDIYGTPNNFNNLGKSCTFTGYLITPD